MALARSELWETGHDESVEVNQRALIDKVLARYSGEFTVFRELLQNSDDAGANAVEIRFETKAFLEARSGKETLGVDINADPKRTLDNKAALVHQWTFKNNGMAFRDEDWNRLKKIAEGNPDEDKIGAFGVGFYSLFSVTEEPFVTSGGQWMGFYWKDKKDQLFVRRGNLPSVETDPWTTFEMSLREPAPIPRPFDLTRFLASSITFMANLSEVNVYLDDRRISKLTKEPGLPRAIEIPRGLRRSSPKGILQIKDMQTTPLSIKAELIRWVYMSGSEKSATKAVARTAPTGGAGGFFSSLFSSLSGVSTPQRSVTPVPVNAATEVIDPTKLIESTVVLSIFTTGVTVKLDQKLRTELHRATKKNPPTSTRLDLIYTGKDEYDASKKEDDQQPEMTGSVFQGLRADLEGVGAARIFIGHATGQTTGLAGHLAARFIPTVERESIDLMDRTVAIWNEELLYVGGFVARAGYELEMDTIRKLWSAAAESQTGSGRMSLAQPDEELQTWLRARALHALKFFTFRSSTPSSLVSAKLEAAFFSCAANHPFPIISTRGVRNATDVRLPNEQFKDFLKELPMLPADLLDGAGPMVKSLGDRGMIREIEFMDVLQELRSRPLSETELVACFKWWIGVQSQGEPRKYAQIRTELLNAAVLILERKDGQDEKIIPMSSVQTFLNVRGMPGAIIPIDGPLPEHLLPVAVSKQIDPMQLSSAFPWRELTLLDWLQPITDPAGSALDVDHDFTKSPQWAERVLQVVARAWPHLSKEMQEQVATLFREKQCIPTSAGMKMPQESYFQSAHVFRDLPIVHLPSDLPIKGHLEKVLQTVGVRKHVDLQIVFNRMIKTGDWTIAELIKYLVAVQSTLSPVEMDRLRMTSAFPRETVVSDGSEKKVARYMAGELYEPLDTFRRLDLPVIDWGDQPKWRGNSEEAKFLFGLGLRRFPPLSVILDLAANQDQNIQSTALQYFLSNFATKYSDYDPANFAQLAFVPAIRQGTRCSAKPSEVFASPSWARLGFPIVDPSLGLDAVTKLKIPEHPPTSRLVNLLEKSPPTTEDVAREWFGILASRISDFNQQQIKVLSQMPFVPIKKVEDGTMRMLPPTQCYFSGSSDAQFHSKLFIFVDFGTQANQFLSACGTKDEPSVEEIAKILLENPRKFYELADGRDNYLIELRNLAVNSRLISPGTMSRLKRAPVLLGSKRVYKDKSTDKPVQADLQADLDDDAWDFQYDLLPSEQVVVADDTNSYQIFGGSIFTAPQEDLLESFYLHLGSRLLSSLVREEYKTNSEIRGSRKATEIRSLILERLPLFLHEHTHTRPKVSFSWLNDEKHFIVRTWGKLTVIKSLQFGNIRTTRSQDSSAVAKRDGRGPVELWLAGNDQVDMYEVATSICRLIFESAKVNDALLFMTILSTDLRALRRRGYNVDRILRQQKAREAEANRVQEKSTALVPSVPQTSLLGSTSPSGPSVPPKAQPASMHSDAESTPNAAVIDTLKRMSASSSMLRSIGIGKKWKFNGRPDAIKNSEDESEPELPPVTGAQLGPHQHGNALSANRSPSPALPYARTLSPGHSNTSAHRTSQTGVTPRSNITANIEMAINACQQEKSEQVRSRENMQMVKETLNEGYCDGSGEAIDISLIGEMGNLKIYASRDVTNATSIMTTKADSIARFIYVIRPLCEIYKLPTTSVHIYYDVEGPRIAFNRNASLFLNLRYFEAWHDQAVQKGEMTDAFVSWYFTLAHEIAHNLVHPHNSEHEFYFSAISEAHLPLFAKLLTTG